MLGSNSLVCTIILAAGESFIYARDIPRGNLAKGFLSLSPFYKFGRAIDRAIQRSIDHCQNESRMNQLGRVSRGTNWFGLSTLYFIHVRDISDYEGKV